MAMTFDEACKLNIPEFTGITPVNSTIWYGLLTDLACSIRTWEGNIPYEDKLLIERYIHNKTMFCITRPRYKVGRAIVLGNYRVFKCSPISYGMQNKVTSVQILVERPPSGLILEYGPGEFSLFDNYTNTSPNLLVKKYVEILSKLDALYEQNIDKLGLPIIGVCEKGMKDDLLNIFKRTKLNALFAIVNNNRTKAPELFYDAKVEFLLDKINQERQAIMREFMQELGVNPSEEVNGSSQYVNIPTVREASLISKYFSATLNNACTNWEEKSNNLFPDLNLSYRATVKSYSEEVTSSGGGEGGEGA